MGCTFVGRHALLRYRKEYGVGQAALYARTGWGLPSLFSGV